MRDGALDHASADGILHRLRVVSFGRGRSVAATPIAAPRLRERSRALGLLMHPFRPMSPPRAAVLAHSGKSYASGSSRSRAE